MRTVLHLLGVLSIFGPSASAAAPLEVMTLPDFMILACSEVVVTGDYFFVGPKEDVYGSSLHRSISRVVKAGQVFGCRLAYLPYFGKTTLEIELRVPHSSENFPFHGGKVSFAPGGKAVNVVMDLDTVTGTVAVYWGIDEKDPEGFYRLSFAIDGVEIDAYEFEIRQHEQ